MIFDNVSIRLFSMSADYEATTDPGEYFLQLIKFRVEKVTEEWKSISHRLDDKMHPYVIGFPSITRS